MNRPRTGIFVVLLCAVVVAPAFVRSEARERADAKPPAGVLAMDFFAQDAPVDLLLFEETAHGKELRHQRSRDGAVTWGAPTTIDRQGRGIANHHRGMDPQIAAAGDTIAVLWTVPGTSKWGEGPLATALSVDGGRTWTLGPNPADDGSNDGHSFLELAADPAGTFSAFWLDSRDGAQGLRVAVSRDGGRSWARNVSIDTRTCECCWNKAVALGPGSFALLYRDKNPRDMALALTTDRGQTWKRTATVGDFGWGVEACPHTGGAIAQTRVGSVAGLHALVWTGAEGHEGLHALTSRDEGRVWSSPTRLGSARAKHADLAAWQSRLAAVWDDTRDGARVILSAVSDDQGATWKAPVQLSSQDRAASHPLVVRTGDRFVAFWTEKGEARTEWRSRPITATHAVSRSDRGTAR